MVSYKTEGRTKDLTKF